MKMPQSTDNEKAAWQKRKEHDTAIRVAKVKANKARRDFLAAQNALRLSKNIVKPTAIRY
jgi:hypothetical protein